MSDQIEYTRFLETQLRSLIPILAIVIVVWNFGALSTVWRDRHKRLRALKEWAAWFMVSYVVGIAMIAIILLGAGLDPGSALVAFVLIIPALAAPLIAGAWVFWLGEGYCQVHQRGGDHPEPTI